MSEVTDEASGRRPRLQRVYELLGAPSLLHRQPRHAMDAETAQVVEDPTALLDFRSHRRVQARWYYPVDHHLVQGSLPRLSKNLLAHLRKKRIVHRRVEDGSSSNNNDKEQKSSSSEEEEEKEDDFSNQEKKSTRKRTFEDREYFKQQSLPLIQQARAHMLLFPQASKTPPPPLFTDAQLPSAQQQTQVQIMVAAYQQYDASHVPARMRLHHKGSRKPKQPGLMPKRVPQTRRYHQERMDRSDPVYLAPFDTPSLRETMAEDHKSRTRVAADEYITGHHIKHRRVPKILADDPNAPTLYGNTLLVIQCPCGYCQEQGHASTWCLLHPSGPLLDCVRLERLELPQSPPAASTKTRDRGEDNTRELDVGDTIRQLAQCGSNTFVARTSLHVTVFEVTVQDKEAPNGCCIRASAQLQKSHRIDLRSFSPSQPSLRPLDLCCHPRYGRDWTDPKLAIVYQASNPEQRNIIRHAMAGSPSLRLTEHTVANLQEISQIDFAAHHPMVLWAAGRSYVRPVLTPDYLSRNPRMGHGCSLYSIDLRCNQATFQWSPSAEDFVMEGVHSVSGLATDWNAENVIWVSSISAGKTWEIDARMPCRAVNVWTLPASCEDSEVTLPATGLYGVGTLLVQPVASDPGERYQPRPILSVNKSPESFGLHLYQRPDIPPRFQTLSLECSSCAGLSFYDKMSVATSSVYPLPDVSDDLFTCGLAAFRTPVSAFLSPQDLDDLGYADMDVTGILCAVTMTNKGDLYTHSLLESKAGHRQSKRYEGLPVGTHALGLPREMRMDPLRNLLDTGDLQVKLQNEFPLPSCAIRPEPVSFRSDMFSDTVEKLDRSLPVNDVTTEGDDDKEKVPLKRIKPSMRSHAVLSRREASIDNTIRLPAQILRKARKELESTTECFDPKRKSIVETQEVAGRQLRSDVTPEILNLSAKAWGDNSDDSDGNSI